MSDLRELLNEAAGELNDLSQAPRIRCLLDRIETAMAVFDVEAEERIEVAYWRFDAKRKGHGAWKSAPMIERDAFKTEMRAMLAAAPEGK